VILGISFYFNFSGPGDGFFSSSLQSTLEGNKLYKAVLPGQLAYGAVVTLKNHKTAGTLLHSHQHLYPKEHPPEQQQVYHNLFSMQQLERSVGLLTF